MQSQWVWRGSTKHLHHFLMNFKNQKKEPESQKELAIPISVEMADLFLFNLFVKLFGGT